MQGTPWEPAPGRGSIEVQSRFQVRGEEDEPIPQPSTCDVVPRRMYIRRKSVTESKYGVTLGCKACEAANRGSTGIHGEACRKRVEGEILHREPERYHRVIEKIGSMVEEDSKSPGAPTEKPPNGAQTNPSAPGLKKRRAQEETYQEGGSSSSGSGNHTTDNAQDPLEARSDVEMEESTERNPAPAAAAAAAAAAPAHSTADKRSRDSEEEGRASKAIRTYSHTKERSRRAGGDGLNEGPSRKILRAHGESRGEVSKTVVLHKPFVNDEGKMVDSIDSIEWEETKDELRELRTPVIHIDGGNRKRGTQACEIQALSGGYFLWQTPKSRNLDLLTLDKIKRIGGSHVTIDDDRVWTNSDVIRRRIMEEKERRAWRTTKGLDTTRMRPWGQVFQQATQQQLNNREIDDDLTTNEYQPRRIHFSESEIYYLDHEGNFWDEVSGNQLNSDEVIKARLDEIKQLHQHDVYDKVPLSECWQSTGRAPVKVKWIDINKGDNVNHEYRSRLVAKEIKMDKRLDLFAATPPLEAKKLLFSAAVTEDVGFHKGDKESGMKIDFIDISRAFFQADAIREVYVELPPEDAGQGMCAKLKKSM